MQDRPSSLKIESCEELKEEPFLLKVLKMKLLEEYWRTLILLYSVEGRETSEVKTKSALPQGFPLPPHTNVSSQKRHMMDFKINPYLLLYSENVKDIIK